MLFSHSVVSDSLWPHGLQHTRLPCPYPSPGVCSNSCPLSHDASNHLILCYPFLLLPSIFPSITIFSSESALCIRWPKYWSFSLSNSPSNRYSGLICFRIDCLISLSSKGLSRVFFSTTVQRHQFSGSQPFFFGPALTSLFVYIFNNSLLKLHWVRKMMLDLSPVFGRYFHV